MAINQAHPCVQLLHEVFSDTQRENYQTLTDYIEAGGSVFPLVEKGVAGLVDGYGLSLSDAQNFLGRANALALYVRRQFIEQTLVGDNTESIKSMSGLLSLVEGPSFERLFKSSFNILCPPDALESVTSPVAYMIDLLKWKRDRMEAYGDSSKMLLEANRRTDLKDLIVDFNAVHQAVSSVDIITLVLEAFIRANKPGTPDLDEGMSTVRYPNGLPYHRDWATIDYVAREHDLSAGAMARQVDLLFPYFLQPNALSNKGERAMLHASRLGPFQRSLLTEEPLVTEPPEKVNAFYALNFGVGPDIGVNPISNMRWVSFFCERTKLEPLDLEALLSIRSFVPVRSANAPVKNNEPLISSGALSGSVYINADSSGDAVDIELRGGADHSFQHVLKNAPHARIDRMNRKLRLDQWLGLPPEQVDALIMAAIRTEARTIPVTAGPEPAHINWISNHTVRAIGLFQELRERCGCTVDDFAVYIHELSIFGRGETLSQFDRVFNPPGFSTDPLILDGGEFPVFPVPGEDALTVNLICQRLGINLHTYRHLAEVIAPAHSPVGGPEQPLKRNLAVLSSFYRMVKLPLLLGITPVEGLLLLLTLGGESWLNALAAAPQLKTNTEDGPPDVLNVIHALDACVRWCAEHDMPVAWMLQQVSPITVPAAASTPERALFEQLRTLLSAALFSDTALLMAGVPPLAGGAGWLDLLGAVVDDHGLVLTQTEQDTRDYPTFARVELDKAVRAGIGEGDEGSRALIVEKMLDVLLQARSGQMSVVKECVAVYANLRSELVLPVLAWAHGTVYEVLRQALERTIQPDEPATYHRQEEDEADPFLVLLADVQRRSTVVVKLDLSVALLEEYLAYGYQVWWSAPDKHQFSLTTLYYLTVLTQAFALGDQPSVKLLDYLREVNQLPQQPSQDALRLAQEVAATRLAIFFTWSIQEVRECALHIDPAQGLVKNLRQLDLLMRVRVLAARTGMDARTIILMGTLPDAIETGINTAAYPITARHALLSLSSTPVPFVPHDGEVLEHMVVPTCTVNRRELVANNPQLTATFTVMVLDLAGQPLSGVNVYWQTELGSINGGKPTVTNPSGVAIATLLPGNVMGTASPRYWLDLHEKQQAPSVVIGVDKTTLGFPSGFMSRVPVGEVPLGQEVELYAVMMDDFDNVASGIPVQWSSQPEGERVAQIQPIIRPSEALTNQEGVTRVSVSSLTAGTFVFKVSVTRSNDDTNTAYFAPITFGAPPPAP